jgi:hypothetical protein
MSYSDDIFILRDEDGIEYSTRDAYEYQQRRDEARECFKDCLIDQVCLLSEVINDATGHKPSPDALTNFAGQLILEGFKRAS